MSTQTPIASITLSAATSSVTFANIPQTYTDLVMVIAGASSNGSAGYIGTQFNSDTSSSYSTTRLLGDGSSASSDRYSSETLCKSGTMWGSIGTNIFQVMNYSNSVTYKTMLNRDNNAGNRVGATVSLWRSTNAITSVTFTCPDGGGFASNSTFNLYGIANASITNTAKATGGDTVVTDGTYWYHVFNSSGTFTPTQAITADCLSIAGGGGGGTGAGGGGGGAGGIVYSSGQALTATAYAVTVGAGGLGGSLGTETNGNNSQFGSLTAAVGGGKGGGDVGSNGGSGGGGATSGALNSFAGGTGTTSQGNAGGSGFGYGSGSTRTYLGGGGGGAGAAGQNASSGDAGNGGIGSSSYSSWGSATNTGQLVSGTYYYAGGGGGSAGKESSGSVVSGASGGNGGGATGRSQSGSISNATANTGGGGGGASYSDGTYYASSNGGSGIVIIRYAV